ncbi:hypothetical protein [Janibacter terrae]|uniref:hypothetical protein n=1 Tax=Janibacter terrae TaxID=103817 RepID=UPI000832EA18|nr:hypothetical protein [Janibacter terrae]
MSTLKRPLLAPLPGHALSVTRMPCARAHVECTCSDLRLAVHASMKSAERAALRHYIDHAPDGPEKARAQQLLEQITEKRKP